MTRVDFGVLVSMLVAAALIAIGAVRGLSYLRDPLIGDFVRQAPGLGVIAYRPDTWWNAQLFKALATPSVVGLQYFVFRWFNRGQRRVLPHASDRDIDFASPWLRLALTGVATAHWFLIEVAKFHWREEFYPWSPLEDRAINAAALLTGQLAAFVGMKRLRFGPLLREEPRRQV